MDDSDARVFDALLKQRRLSTQDRNLARQAYQPPTVMQHTRGMEMRPYNLEELDRSILNARSPVERAILEGERNKLRVMQQQGVQQPPPFVPPAEVAPPPPQYTPINLPRGSRYRG